MKIVKFCLLFTLTFSMSVSVSICNDAPISIDNAIKELIKLVQTIREDKMFMPNELNWHLPNMRTPADIIGAIEDEDRMDVKMIEEKMTMENGDYKVVDMPAVSPSFGKKRHNFAGYSEVIDGRAKKLATHGIESEKGGIRNLLNIMISGSLFARFTAGLADGNPAYFAGPHGPYYIIINFSRVEKEDNNNARLKNNIYDEEFISAYLVPDERKQIILEKLLLATSNGFINEEERALVEKKIITYSEFIGVPKKYLSDNNKFDNYMKRHN